MALPVREKRNNHNNSLTSLIILNKNYLEKQLDQNYRLIQPWEDWKIDADH